MTNRTYFRVNCEHLGEDELVVCVNELVPIPSPGTRISITTASGRSADAEVISAIVEIVEISDRSSLYEQTIYCNGRT